MTVRSPEEMRLIAFTHWERNVAPVRGLGLAMLQARARTPKELRAALLSYLDEMLAYESMLEVETHAN